MDEGRVDLSSRSVEDKSENNLILHVYWSQRQLVLLLPDMSDLVIAAVNHVVPAPEKLSIWPCSDYMRHRDPENPFNVFPLLASRPTV